jgi:hypothetical protein
MIEILQTLIFQCKDIRSNWDSSIVSQCFKPKQLLILSYTNTGEVQRELSTAGRWLISTALNILTDLIFAMLPVFMLRYAQFYVSLLRRRANTITSHLQVNRRVKASLICILGLGVL